MEKPDLELSEQVQHSLPDWVIYRGGYLVMARGSAGEKWVLFWPTAPAKAGGSEAEGVIADRETAMRVYQKLRDRSPAAEVKLMPIGPALYEVEDDYLPTGR